ncbi:MAG: ADP-ribosylation factor-like protein [Promethearchaeota archaeon]
MLQNIFVFKGKNFQDLDNLNIYNYPEELITLKNADLIGKIIYGHDIGDITRKYRESKNLLSNNNNNHNTHNQSSFLYEYIIDTPVAQIINELNIYTSCLNGRIIIGLIFEKDDNPYDYRSIFEELLNELLNIEKMCSFREENEIENFIITLFIDIRRYADEYIHRVQEMDYFQDQTSVKVFLFGLNEAGKTSLVRRLKTGEYDDNYFMPTRKFNIDHIQVENSHLLTIWDMPGQRQFRKKWLIGAQDSNIIVFMIDISNQIHFEEARSEFWRILNSYELSRIPLLILGNKIDLLNESNPKETKNEHLDRLRSELLDFFEFESIHDREWLFLFTSVKTEYNLESVLNEIFNLIKT